MLVLRPPCSVGADHIGNYLEMRLDREDKLEGKVVIYRRMLRGLFLEKMSDMCVGKFGAFKRRLDGEPTKRRNETPRLKQHKRARSPTRKCGLGNFFVHSTARSRRS